jgi:hypothetical protein
MIEVGPPSYFPNELEQNKWLYQLWSRVNILDDGYDDILFEIKAEPHYVYASSGSLGGLADAGASTGSYQDTRVRNGIYWKIEESSGTDDYLISTTNPLIFDDVEQVPTMFWSGVYNGSSTHASSLKWIVYNNNTTAWDDLTYTFTAGSLENAAIVSGFVANHINASKQVKIALKHPDTGNAAHYCYLDEIYLAQDNVPKRTYYKGSFIDVFRNTGYDMAHGRVQLRHGYKLGTNVALHVHFVNHVGTIADGQTVIFTFTQSFAGIYRTFPTEGTITCTFINDAAWRSRLSEDQAADIMTGTTVKQGSHLVCGGATQVDGANLGISAIGLLEVKRTAGTYTGDVGVLYADGHIEQDTVGSRLEFVK